MSDDSYKCPKCGGRFDDPDQCPKCDGASELAPARCSASWALETMMMINRLTPDIKGKAFDPDWFLLRQRLESVTRKPTDEEIRLWAENHGFEGHSLNDLRCAFEDAQTMTQNDKLSDGGLTKGT